MSVQTLLVNQEGKVLRPLGGADAQGRSLFVDQDGQVVAQDPQDSAAPSQQEAPRYDPALTYPAATATVASLPPLAGNGPVPVEAPQANTRDDFTGQGGQPQRSPFNVDQPDVQGQVPGGVPGVRAQSPQGSSPRGGAASGPVQVPQPQIPNTIAIPGTQPQVLNSIPVQGAQPQVPNTIFIPSVEGGVHVPIVDQEQSATVTSQTNNITSRVSDTLSPRVAVSWGAAQNAQAHSNNLEPGIVQILPPRKSSIPDNEVRSAGTTSPDRWLFGTQATPGERPEGDDQGIQLDSKWSGVWIPDSATGQWLLDASAGAWGARDPDGSDGWATKVLPGSAVS